MAFSALLAAVSDEQVAGFRNQRRLLLETSMSANCSHVLTSWVRPDDLRQIWGKAIDGGENLRFDLWHPQRAPIWHSSTSVVDLDQKLRGIWAENLEKSAPLDPADWYGIEIRKVLSVFRYASDTRNGVVSFLNKPMDEERAKRVLIPVAYFASGQIST